MNINEVMRELAEYTRLAEELNATIDDLKDRINCGAKSCFGCGLCYEKNGVKIINEKLK